ncbi:MAG: NlpC/P60 family protein [Planctomycetota bacterium]
MSDPLAPLLNLTYEEAGGCWGLAARAAQIMGLVLPESPEDALARRTALGTVVDGRAPARGDLVVFDDADGRADHVGIMVDRFRVLHASSSAGVLLQRLEHVAAAHPIRSRVRLEAQS